MRQDLLERLSKEIEKTYMKCSLSLPFHGWHHISFVYNKSLEFANDLSADSFFVGAAALTHDLNYLVKVNSMTSQGKDLRNFILAEVGFDKLEILRIEKIVNEANISVRDKNISLEAKALSDADTLFKALPITPIIFAKLYAQEQSLNIKDLAIKIVRDQERLLEQGIYFYSKNADRYLKWAQVNIELWKNVVAFFSEEDFSNYFQLFTEFKLKN